MKSAWVQEESIWKVWECDPFLSKMPSSRELSNFAVQSVKLNVVISNELYAFESYAD